MGKYHTLWGWTQDKITIVPGIDFYSTASHGGFVLSDEYNKKIPPYMRNDSRHYEEDAEWSKVVVVFKDHFTTEEYKKAVNVFRNWFPTEYETFFDETIKPGQSLVKDENRFKKENKNNFVGRAAFGSWHETVPNGFVGLYLIRESDGKEITKLIPKDEYSKQWSHFVIKERDLEKYEDWHHNIN